MSILYYKDIDNLTYKTFLLTDCVVSSWFQAKYINIEKLRDLLQEFAYDYCEIRNSCEYGNEELACLTLLGSLAGEPDLTAVSREKVSHYQSLIMENIAELRKIHDEGVQYALEFLPLLNDFLVVCIEERVEFGVPFYESESFFVSKMLAKIFELYYKDIRECQNFLNDPQKLSSWAEKWLFQLDPEASNNYACLKLLSECWNKVFEAVYCILDDYSDEEVYGDEKHYDFEEFDFMLFQHDLCKIIESWKMEGYILIDTEIFAYWVAQLQGWIGSALNILKERGNIS